MDNVLTNVQKTQLDNIAIPGHESGFHSDIYAIVDFDTHVIYRYYPKNKIFTTNQMAVAYFEEAAQNLNLQLQCQTSKLMYNGAQMGKAYTSRAIDDTRYQLRFYLYNAYDKGTGHILLAQLMAPPIHNGEVQLNQTITNGQARHAYFHLPENTFFRLDDMSISETQTVLEKILTETRKQIHFLTWAMTKELNDPVDFFRPIYHNLNAMITSNAYWLMRGQQMNLLEAIGKTNSLCFMPRSLIDTDASPKIISIQKRVKKWSDHWNTFRETTFNRSMLRRGYRYEEPNQNEQGSPDNGGSPDLTLVPGDPDTQRGDDSPSPVPDDLAG